MSSWDRRMLPHSPEEGRANRDHGLLDKRWGPRFYRARVLQGPGSTGPGFYRTRVLQDPGFIGAGVLQKEVLQGPGSTGVRVLQGPRFCRRFCHHARATYPYLSARSRASSSFTARCSLRSHLFPHRTMSGFSQ